MLAGHFGLAAIVKSRERQVPLWSLVLSTQLLDIVFLILFLLGIESFRPVQGTSGGYGNFIFQADYSHSLVGALGISLLAMLITLPFWGRRNGLIIGAMVFSHWVLDLPVHRADLPVLPGNAGGLPRLGLGLWAMPWLVAALELGLVLAGAYFYYHAAMRAAVAAERKEARQGVSGPKPYRRNAAIASVALLVSMLGLLVGDLLGI
jgi:hypothetical protein